jgi:hypothetical protein
VKDKEVCGRNKLDIAANWAIIITAVFLTTALFRHNFRLTSSATTEGETQIHEGAQLPALAGWEWRNHSQTILLALRTDCQFCRRNIAFYKQLLANKSINSNNVIALFPQTRAVVLAYLQENGISNLSSLPAVDLSALQVRGTPTVALINSSGRVERVWVGELTRAAQPGVLRSLSQ